MPFSPSYLLLAGKVADLSVIVLNILFVMLAAALLGIHSQSSVLASEVRADASPRRSLGTAFCGCAQGFVKNCTAGV